MVTEDCLNRVLPVVADSWAQLRRSDVDRLLNQLRYENKASLLVAAGIVAAKRPDLQKQIDQAVEWISEERGMDEAVGAPSTRDYVFEHINALGPQQESSLVAWMLLQLPTVETEDDAKRLLDAHPSVYQYSEDGRVYYTTRSQDPRGCDI